MVMIKEPGGLLKADLTAEGVFKPVMIGEVFSRTPLPHQPCRGIDANKTAEVKGLMEVKPSPCNGVA